VNWRRRSEQAERELDEELQAHLDLEVEQNIERGMPPEDARLAARRKLGNLTVVKEASREAREPVQLDRLLQDVRFGVRMLLKSPGFSAVAILSLALGVGAVTAIFSFVNAILLRPLPFREPDRLVVIWLNNPRMASSVEQLQVSDALYQDWRDHSRSFDGLASFGVFTSHLTKLGPPEYVTAAALSASTLPILGVRPILGRNFRREEEPPGQDDVILLSYDFWNRQYGGRRDILGKGIMVDNQLCTIIGVTPPGFQFPVGSVLGGERIDFFQPMPASPQATRFAMQLNRPVLGRLKPGVGIDQARRELTARTLELARRYFPPERKEGWSAVVLPLHEQTVRYFRPALLMLLGSAAFVLLIACVNVANLLVGRAARRRHEIALRVALGAGRLRIVRQVLTESVLLALCGGAVGAALAAAGLKGLIALAPVWVPRLAEASLDPRVLGVTLAMTILTGLLFGLAPALEALRSHPGDALKCASARFAPDSAQRRVQRILVAAEIGLSVMLVSGANVTLRSFIGLMNAPTGFRADKLLTMQIPMQASKYGDEPRRLAFIGKLLAKCTNLPGVESAAITDQLPMRSHNESTYLPEEQTAGRDPITAQTGGVTPAYFRSMGIRMESGRPFTEDDRASGPLVGIVSRTAARMFWPGLANPIGRRFKRDSAGAGSLWMTVVGVVDDVRLRGLDEKPFPQIYLPYEQYHQDSFAGQMFLELAVRFSFDPAPMTAAVRAQIRGIDEDQPVTRVKLMKEAVEESAAAPKFQTLVCGLFAAIALPLAGVGVYGVLSYSVEQRRHEIGVRVALGAGRRQTLQLILGDGMMLAVFGSLAGLGAALAITPTLRSYLYGVQGMDAIACCTAALVLLVVAALSAYVPARRAARVDPVITLRHE